MNDIAIDVDMPGMPHTSICINSDCRVFMFVDDPKCPQCDEVSVYKVSDMKYYVIGQ